MDFSTIVGLIAVILMILKAVGSNFAGAYDGLSLLIVLVGGIAATLVAYPFRDAINVFAVLKQVFLSGGIAFRDLIEKIVGYAETARREGILALESAVKEDDDPFMAAGIRLAVDGTEPELIQVILQTELTFVEERHGEGQRLLKTLGIHWAIFGGIGALIVLILGPGEASGFDLISRAGLPLLYGLLLAGFSAIPFRRKLEVRSKEETLRKRMIMEGIMSIQSGDNPRIVEQKLNVFLAPARRAASKPKQAPPAPPPEPEVQEEIPQDDAVIQQSKAVIGRLQSALQDEEKGVPKPFALESLLSLLSEETRQEVLEMLGERPPMPAGSVLTFGFEDIAGCTDREIQMILREVDTKDLALAMQGAGRTMMDRIFANVSDRVAAMIREEMRARRSSGIRNVVDAQLRIIHVVRQLEEHGQVTIRRGEG